jgi:hypothetical protein
LQDIRPDYPDYWATPHEDFLLLAEVGDEKILEDFQTTTKKMSEFYFLVVHV